MSQAVETSRITAEAFLHYPDDGRRWELIEGQVVEMAPPNAEHGSVAALVTAALVQWTQAHGHGLVACNDPGIVLQRDPDTVRAPDVALWLRRRPTSEERQGYLEIVPDLVVEVVSRSDREPEVLAKAGQWLTAGVIVVWLIWPAVQRLAVLRADQAPVYLERGDRISDEPLLPGFTLSVNALFPTE